MDFRHIYWEVKRILNDEPDLKKEFDELRYSLKELPDDFSRDHFDMLYQEYEDFIEILINLVNLPKINYSILISNLKNNFKFGRDKLSIVKRSLKFHIY